MSKVLSILLVVLYGLTLSQAYMLQVSYWMNRDYIATVLCENQDKPELECNGKCHLKKQVQKQSESQNDGEETSERLMVEFVKEADRFSCAGKVESNEKIPCNYCEDLIAGVKRGVFHPPQLLLAQTK